MSTLYGCSVTFLISLYFKGYSEKNYDVTCTLLFQGNVRDPNANRKTAHIARDVIGQLMKMLSGDE